MDDASPRRHPRSRPLKLRKVTIGRREVFTSGIAPGVWTDLYHATLTVGWPAFLGGLAGVYVFTNAVFALLYRLGPDSVANSHGDIENLFYFSVETLTTVGYGEFSPQTRYGHVLVAVETFTGLFFTASMLGLIFARMSRPRARLLFARHLAVGPHEGRLTLHARVANARLNVIGSARARLWMLAKVSTAERVGFRRFIELPLLRSENPTFVLSWTILHVIDEASPLHGRTAEDLAAEDVFFVLTITGEDETFAQTVQARETYGPDDLRWGSRYVDVLSVLEDGTTFLDYDRFHAVEPVGDRGA